MTRSVRTFDGRKNVEFQLEYGIESLLPLAIADIVLELLTEAFMATYFIPTPLRLRRHAISTLQGSNLFSESRDIHIHHKENVSPTLHLDALQAVVVMEMLYSPAIVHIELFVLSLYARIF